MTPDLTERNDDMDLADRLAEDGDVTESDIISVRARVPDTQQEDEYSDDGEF